MQQRKPFFVFNDRFVIALTVIVIVLSGQGKAGAYLGSD